MRGDIKSTYIIRKSFPLLIIRLVVLELLLESIYVGWRFGIDYLSIASDTKIFLHSLTTAVFIFVTLIQIILLLVIVIKWLNEYYEMQDDEIIQWTGVITKRGRSYPYSNIQSITIQQSAVGRILNFGTVVLYVPTLGQDLSFDEVPKPQAFIKLIKEHMPTNEEGQFLIKRGRR